MESAFYGGSALCHRVSIVEFRMLIRISQSKWHSRSSKCVCANLPQMCQMTFDSDLTVSMAFSCLKVHVSMRCHFGEQASDDP